MRSQLRTRRDLIDFRDEQNGTDFFVDRRLRPFLGSSRVFSEPREPGRLWRRSNQSRCLPGSKRRLIPQYLSLYIPCLHWRRRHCHCPLEPSFQKPSLAICQHVHGFTAKQRTDLPCFKSAFRIARMKQQAKGFVRAVIPLIVCSDYSLQSMAIASAIVVVGITFGWSAAKCSSALWTTIGLFAALYLPFSVLRGIWPFDPRWKYDCGATPDANTLPFFAALAFPLVLGSAYLACKGWMRARR